MAHMICSHRVEDFGRWYAVFRDHAADQKDAGLRIRRVMRDVDDPDRIVMWFEIDDPAAAIAFMARPEAEEAGREAGVVGDAEVVFLEDLAT